MNLEPRDVLIINLVIVILIVGSYLFIRRTPQQPVRLNLKNPGGEGSGKDVPGAARPTSVSRQPAPSIRNPSRVEYRPRTARPGSDLTDSSGPAKAAELQEPRHNDREAGMDLNVLFQWNGHTWDAYEVLGIPAGSSPGAVKAAFERLSRSADAESRPFLQAAVSAIATARGRM